MSNICHAHALPGAQGGSHLANDEVRRIVAKSVEASIAAGVYFPEGSIAKYVKCFESLKRARDFNYQEYITQKKCMFLHIQDGPQLRIDLKPKQIKKIFGTAFDKGLAALDQEMQSVIASSKDIAVLFTGGSYQSMGLRSQAVEKIQELQDQIKREKKAVKINIEFLGKTEMRW